MVGEKITRAVEYATKHRLPVIIFTASEVQECRRDLSLMQMAKVSGAIANIMIVSYLYFCVNGPNYRRCNCQLCMEADIILAEPGALIGFAGKRVIENTIKQQLPEGFQTAEFLLEKGFIDKIVHRTQLRSTLAKILQLHGRYSYE